MVDVARIMAYEAGELPFHDMVDMFGELVQTGLAWTLQGAYGRAAADLVQAELISPDGAVNADRVAEIEGGHKGRWDR